MLQTPADIDKAFQAFRQFLAWRKEHDVRAIACEESLVSERWQFGGTLDIVALVDGVRCLLDFKTCKTAGDIYLEQRLVMAAHGALWHEHHPDLPLAGYHLITLPKDGSRFGHHAFANLLPEWEMFTLQLDCWRIEKGLTRKRSVKPTTVMLAPKTKLMVEALAEADAHTAKPKRTRTPKPEQAVAAPTPRRTRKAQPAPATSVPVVPAVVVQRNVSPWASRFVVMAIAAGAAVITWMREAA